MILRKNLPFLLLTFSVLIGLILPALIQDGMFMDGQQYACVAKNLAHNKGTFWFPYLSQTWSMGGSNSFMEQPPLVYWLQSLFFRLFGDSMYVERFYSLVIALLNAFIIMAIWKNIPFEDKSIQKTNWLPVLFWILIPTCYWSYNNNMLENTMGLFTSLAVFFILKGIQEQKKSLAFFILGGISIFLATLSKGIPGLFPLATLFFYGLLFPKQISVPKAIGKSILIFMIPAIIYLLLMLYQPAHDSLAFYVTKRLLYRVNNNPTVTSRFYILGGILEEMIPILVLCLLIVLPLRREYPQIKYNQALLKQSLFFLLLALSASVPLLLTPVQKKFYMHPSFAFFGIALAILCAPYVTEWLKRNLNNQKTLRTFSFVSVILLVLVVSVSFTQKGKASRDKDMLHDVYIVGNIIKPNSIITLHKSMKDIWSLQFYLLRYYNISCTFPDQNHYYFLEEKTLSKPDTSVYKKMDLDLREYDLYRRKLFCFSK